LINPHQQ